MELACDNRRTRLLLVHRQSPLETAALLPKAWSMLPEVANGALLDVAHRRRPVTDGDIPIRLELQHGQRRAEQAALMGSMGLCGDAEGVWVTEIRDHGLELSIAVCNVIALPLHLDQLSHDLDCPFDISRPVRTALEPPSVFR